MQLYTIIIIIGVARGGTTPPNRNASNDKFVTKKAILPSVSFVGLFSVRAKDLFL